jgi:hypothetical protein
MGELLCCTLVAVASLYGGTCATLSLFGFSAMHKAERTQLCEVMERMARVKWNRRNVWMRVCHANRCKEHRS